jgi:hypothetical protein
MRYENRVVCDFCDAETDDPECWPPQSGQYCINQVTIQLKTGENYIETKHGKTLTIDMCPKCFLEKLIPWFESQGIEVREEIWHN